ncbi:cellobiose phosphorylase [Paenibacillus cellulositrophicus]|uniref:GH36-type glycosyl hydrolase domain-containing protein n=1 Tax=Paenibacillus cellulositrophicus TaxID=562959 RepID=UPI00203A5B96|nr:cellobiose phosphorylase [Paenibacillus cellulositrophicus]MCM3001918.1 cellobiose phosphorylase [Paenibacillus cellulositrophicus]
MTTITNSKLHVQAGDLSFTFWESGDLFQAVSGKTMINQLMSSPLDGALNNLYLRIHDDSAIRFYPLLGIRSDSRVSTGEGRIVWTGEAEGVAYSVTFALSPLGVWFWDVRATGQRLKIDVVYGQDIGDADPGAVRSNEAYLSQYIDHTVFEDKDHGYVVCSRQNQPQGGAFPYIQQGSLTRAAGFSTDGFQFFGLSYKETNVPACLSQPQLANEVYQYEFAYTALQSEAVTLDGEARFVFYGLFKPDHAAAVTELEFKDEVLKAWDQVQANLAAAAGPLHELPRVRLNPEIGEPLRTLPLTAEELEALFPADERQEEETENGQLLAFFTDTYEHVVLKEKELRVERPHGHILMSGGSVKLGAKVVTTTSYMYGIFNSHLVVGNTNFNKMMSNARSALNVPKTAGQRIYVNIEGVYRLLTMPSLFEIGFNYVRWYYKTAEDMLVITNFAAADAPEVRLHVRSESGKTYEFLVTSQVTMAVNEFEAPVRMTESAGVLTFHGAQDALRKEAYPHLKYTMRIDGAKAAVSDETALASGVQAGEASVVTLKLDAAPEWTLTMQGLLDGEDLPEANRSAEDEIAKYREFFRDVMNGFRLTGGDGTEGKDFFKVNALAWWYTHNMLVHYSVPHGLEQYGGAAWGTRDVCQGPTEYFMATQKFEQVRDILTMVYSHQYEDDGNWPQWFMFDNYFTVQQEESHGDIIVWPLKVLSDYLRATEDFGILEEKVPYTVKHKFHFTEETATILDHVYKEIGYIRSHFLHDTHLSSYGDGDWDDTLQPANAQLKQYMVSSWTVALTYQTMTQLSGALKSAKPELAQELHDMAQGIKRDYEKYMLGTEVIPGFLYMENPDEVKLMLHPTDEETGIQYRLLPMTRSMIAELLDPERAKAHYELIKEKLFFPDGVRLMNRPAQYVGGVSTHFKRAEQASNFGREVGLQYVHAHIRFIEAMAKLGHADDVWNGLNVINPVGIRNVVPNAELRQSNAYFSSSDGKFNTRYDAQAHFDELRSGSVQVKGGWRIYSSGPGIYMNQLISNALGIRQEQQDLIVDPVLPQKLDGLRFDFRYDGQDVAFIYHLSGTGERRVKLNGRELEASAVSNPYREGGLRISKDEFEQGMKPDGHNVVEIFM